MLGYTGTFEGAPISVQSTGMGCPSAGIVYEELIQLGAHAARPRRHVRCHRRRHGDGRHGDRHRCIGRRHDRRCSTPRMAGYAPTATFTLAETAARLARESGAATCTSGRSSRRRCSTTPTRQRRPVEAPRPPRHRDGGGDALHGRRRPRHRGAGDDDGQRPRQRPDESSASPTTSCKRGVDAMIRLACRVAVARPRRRTVAVRSGRAPARRRARRPARLPRRRSCRGCTRRCRGPARSSTRRRGTCTGSSR